MSKIGSTLVGSAPRAVFKSLLSFGELVDNDKCAILISSADAIQI